MDYLVDTFLPTTVWLKLEQAERIKIIQDFLVSQELEFQMLVVSAPDNGQVVLTTNDILPPAAYIPQENTIVTQYRINFDESIWSIYNLEYLYAKRYLLIIVNKPINVIYNPVFAGVVGFDDVIDKINALNKIKIAS